MFKFYQVGCQKDYFEEPVAIPESALIRPNLAKLTDFAMDNEIQILASMDSLTEDLIKECKVCDPYVQIIPAQRAVRVYEDVPQVIFETLAFSEYELNKRLMPYIKRTGTSAVVVYGVLTEKQILSTVKEFIKEKIEVFVVMDAIKGYKDEISAIKQMEKLGAKFVRTDYVISENGLFEFPEED